MKALGELAVFISTALGLAALALFTAVILAGCAPQRPKSVAQPAPALMATPPASVPVSTSPEGWQPVIEHRPDNIQTRVERPRRPVEVMGPGGKTIVYEPGKKPIITCSEFGFVTIQFPAGEKVLKFGSGASAEWTIERADMGVDLPIGALAIHRTPWAPVAELHVWTDAAAYQFILTPTAGGVSTKQVSLFQIMNPETEARRAERQERREEMLAQQRKEMEITAPQLDAATVRTYEIGGDHVQWAPVNVVGDHQHTVIQLPANSGAGQPTLTVIEYGKEMRVNTRTLPEENGKGPRIIVDQPFTEARLIGDGGSVSIVGRGN